MGNQKSREENNFKLQTRIRHPLPPELLYEITKWIPIKIERRQEKQQNQSTTLEDYPLVKRFAFWLQNKKRKRTRHSEFLKLTITYIGPENENILMASRILTAFLRQKYGERRKMITKLATDYSYEPNPPSLSPIEEDCFLLIKKKADTISSNNSPKLTMLEMMRHFYFGRPFILDESHTVFYAPIETMPDDFKPDHFIRTFLEYATKSTTNIDIMVQFRIDLTEQQYECVLNVFDNGNGTNVWVNMLNRQNDFELYYGEDYYYYYINDDDEPKFCLDFIFNPHTLFI